MSTKEVEKSADEQLSVVITNALINAKLIPEAKRQALIIGLTGGRMVEQDWKLLIESAMSSQG